MSPKKAMPPAAKAAVAAKAAAKSDAIPPKEELEVAETQLVEASQLVAASEPSSSHRSSAALPADEIKRFKSAVAYGAKKGDVYLSRAQQQYANAKTAEDKAQLLEKFKADKSCKWCSEIVEHDAEVRMQDEDFLRGWVSIYDMGKALQLPSHLGKDEYEAIVLASLDGFPCKEHPNAKLAAMGHKLWDLGEEGVPVGPQKVTNRNTTGRTLTSSADVKRDLALQDENPSKRTKVKLEYPDFVKYCSLIKAAKQNIAALEKVEKKAKNSATNCRCFLSQYETVTPLDHALAVRTAGQDMTRMLTEAQRMIEDYELLIGLSKNVRKDDEAKVQAECAKLDVMAANVVTVSQALTDQAKKCDDVEAEAEVALNETAA